MSSHDATLVGRATELAVLGDAIAAAQRGRGTVLLVHGEPGIGKSALARALADAAEPAGLRVAWGRAWEAGGAPPFWPWVEVLREVIAEVGDAVLDEVGELAPIAELVAELHDRRPGTTPPVALDPAAARFRMFDAVARLLRRAAHERPLAIVLDDLHAADLPSLELLQFVAAGVRTVPMIVLGTHRDVEPRLSTALGEALARVRRHATPLPVGRLDRTAIRELARRLRPEADERLVEAIARTTEGNPLFVLETLRLGDGAAGATAEGIRAVLRERLHRLPEATLRLLELGAALGREIDSGLVAMAADTTVAAVHEAMRPAIAQDVVAERPEQRLAFTHVLLRDALYRDVPEHRRAQVHLALGEALERSVAVDPRTRVVGLARHFIAAIPAAAPERAIDHACRAAERAVELQAHEEAVAILERLLAALDAHAGSDSGRIDVLLALGNACIRGGEVERGRQACLRAVELARSRGDAERLARAALGLGERFTFAVVDPTLVAILREALAALPEEPSPLRARLLARLAAALQPAPDPTGPMQLAREAIAMVHRVGDPRTRLAVLGSAVSALLYFAHPRERAVINREIVELARVLGDEVQRARGELRLVFDALELGDTAAADGHVRELAAIAEALALPTHAWTLRMVRSMRAAATGRFADAERLAADADAIAAHSDEPNLRFGRIAARVGRLATATRWDDLAAIEPEFRAVITATADAPYSRACLLAIAARIGRTAECRQVFDELCAALEVYRERPTVAFLAEVCVHLGDRERAPAIVELLRPYADRWQMWGIATMSGDGPITEPLGRLASLMGDHDEAIGWLGDAERRCEASGALPHLARVRVELALALRARGQPGDLEAADAALASARDGARTLGMPGLLARIEAMTTATPIAPVSAPDVPSHPAFRLVRDGETWAIHTGGTTLRLKDSRGVQILAQLVARPGEALHVLELLGAGEGVDRGDAGPALDATAIREYRARATKVRDAIEDAEEIGDTDRAERLRAELEAIAHELARGVGLGGRARRDGSAIERARVNVRRRLTDAIGRIAALDPALGRHLEWAVKTGVFCSYRPGGR